MSFHEGHVHVDARTKRVPDATLDDWTSVEDEAFADHLRFEGGAEALEEYIRAGGRLAGYAQEWKDRRDSAARAKEPSPELVAEVLALPVVDWRKGATVRDYLVALLAGLWAGDAGQKYGMTGESDWRYDIYRALSKAGVIPGWRDGYGLDETDSRRADQLVCAAIATLTAPQQPAAGEGTT